MMKSYVALAESELRAASNRTFQRLLQSLPPLVARLYGHVVDQKTVQELELQLQEAAERKDWSKVGQIAAQLREHDTEWG